MVDIEASRTTTSNPYSSGNPDILPTYHPINVLWRLLYMTLALWGLHHFQAYQKILHDPNIRHEVCVPIVWCFVIIFSFYYFTQPLPSSSGSKLAWQQPLVSLALPRSADEKTGTTTKLTVNNNLSCHPRSNFIH